MQQCNVLPWQKTGEHTGLYKMEQIMRQPSSTRLRPASLAR